MSEEDVPCNCRLCQESKKQRGWPPVLSLNDYQRAARRTAGKLDTKQDALICNALGAAGEAGELANKVKKAIFHKHGIQNEVLMDEAGDVLWYLAALADAMGVSLQDIAEMNVAKLARRYPEGFSSEKSIHRSE